MNLIILYNNKTNIEGNLAGDFFFAHKDIIKRIRYISGTTNTAWVYETDGTLRAAQFSVDGAAMYMKPDRILIVRREK